MPLKHWPKGPLVTLVALGASVLATIAGGVVVWRHYTDDATRWAAVAGVGTGGAVGLASIAAIVATVAYKDATLRSNLKASMSLISGPLWSDSLRDSAMRLVEDSARALPQGAWLYTEMTAVHPVTVYLRVANESLVTARNVQVRIEFLGLHCWSASSIVPPAGWDGEVTRANGMRSLAWEGGVDRVIHGQQWRDWQLSFQSCWATSDPPTKRARTVLVTAVADGCKQRFFQFPLELIDKATADRLAVKVEIPIKGPDAARPLPSAPEP